MTQLHRKLPTARVATLRRPADLRRLALLTGLAALLCLLSAGTALPQTPADPGDFVAEAGGKKHKKRQGRPVKLGTSGGNVDDFTIDGDFITCCSGTLGALLEKNGRYFILSNNHVLARVNQAGSGEPVNQPGMIDNSCLSPESDFVANLTGFKKIKLQGRNKVDAAIAEVVEGTVDAEGTVLKIGVPGNDHVLPTVGMPVKKSGRTTGFTRGEVIVTNYTGFIEFAADCSEDAVIHTVLFKKQFIVVGNKKDFSAGGDSGSVIYLDTKDCPPAVGLLFAGAGEFTLANRMKDVIKAAKKMKPKGKASLVGCEPAAELVTTAGLEGLAAEVAVSGSDAGAAGRSRAPKLLGVDDPAVQLAERVQRRVEGAILSLSGVHGVGIGRSDLDPAAAALKVTVDGTDPAVLARIPREIDGLPVEVMQLPRFRTYRDCERVPVEPVE